MKIPKFEFRGDVLYIDGVKVTQSTTPHTSGSTNLQGGLVVLHYTANNSLSGTLNWFKDPKAKVSAHFVIGQDGKIAQVLSPRKKAWHAGESEWTFEDGRYVDGVNSVSVGIEMVKMNGAAPWPMDQVISCVLLVRALHKTYGTKEVAGHDDVAPGRKVDPGEAFWPYWEKAVAEIDAAGGTPEVPVTPPTPEAPEAPEVEMREETISCPHCGEAIVIYVEGKAKMERAEYE